MNFQYAPKLSDFIWINGEFVPWNDAYIHVLTHSLHYSGAVFEGERAYKGVVFKLEEHTKRLLKSAKYMNLKVNYSAAEINKATEGLLKKNSLEYAYIRPLIWRGAESIGVYDNKLNNNILIAAIPSKNEFINNVRLILSNWSKVSTKALPVQAKSSAHYAMAIISQNNAELEGYNDSLVLDDAGFIAECNVANIFFGKNNEIVTPIADKFLNGITRQAVIELVKNNGFNVIEKRMKINEISSYDYCFMTGTAKEIAGIKEINLKPDIVNFVDSKKIVPSLQEKFAQLVGK